MAKKIMAWNELKTIREWLDDDRSGKGLIYQSLYQRIKNGNCADNETAISSPKTMVLSLAQLISFHSVKETVSHIPIDEAKELVEKWRAEKQWEKQRRIDSD